MTESPSNRGSTPVGAVADLDTIEAEAVLYLRLWANGPLSQAQVWNDFASALGARQGAKALKSFEAICKICATHGRRPLRCRHVTCTCLGADEACFANIVGSASEGAREDALMIAMNIVRPDMAAALVSMAEDVGLALRRMALKTDRHRAVSPANHTIH